MNVLYLICVPLPWIRTSSLDFTLLACRTLGPPVMLAFDLLVRQLYIKGVRMVGLLTFQRDVCSQAEIALVAFRNSPQCCSALPSTSQ